MSMMNRDMKTQQWKFSVLHGPYSHMTSDAIQKKHFFFFHKNMFFRIKNLASKKNTQKVFFLFFLNTHLKEITR